MQDFRELSVWQKSHQLVLRLYRATQPFPQNEEFGLTRQLRRAAVSIPSNLAEGCGRGTDRDFARFVQIAMGSASEVEYQLLLANDLGYLIPGEASELQARIAEIKRMLSGLLSRLRVAQRR